MFSLMTLAAAAALSARDDNTTFIMAGRGFSTDTQQVSQQTCYAASISSVNGAESHIALQAAMSFSDLETSIQRQIDVGFGVGVFDIGAETGYLRSIQDTEYSLSLNYYQYTSATVSVQLQGTGVNALTDFGKQMYTSSDSTYFRIVCGDNYLTSYKEGALLLLGINVVLRDQQQRKTFAASLTVGVNDIVSATATVQKVAQENSLTGQVVIGAYQVGGNPNDLTKILAKDSTGAYFVLACSLNNMTACQQAANGLLDYATNDFPTQFSFSTGQGTSFLGQGYFTYQPAEYLGLTMAKSVVTQDVVNARQTLASKLRESQYYVQSFYPLVQSYPVAWDQTSPLYTAVVAGYKNSVANVATILNYVNPEQGAVGCFDTPNQCVALEQQIVGALVDVSASVQAVAALQWMIPFGAAQDNSFAVFMFDGTNYAVAVLPTPANGNAFTAMGPWSVSPTYLHYEAYYQANRDARLVNYNGTSTDGSVYNGTACHGTPGKPLTMCGNLVLTHTQNPFFFNAYSS